MLAVAELDRTARRALVMVDPNIRPALIGARADYLARLGRILQRCDVLKASVEDLAWLARTAPAGRGTRTAGLGSEGCP
jgi:fructokinase